MKRLLHTPSLSAGLWAHPDARLVLPARAVSFFGDSVALVVLSLRLAESHRPALMTMLFIAFSLPLFALSSVAGRIVDEYDSRRLLVIAGSLQVLASLGLVWGPNAGAILGFVALLQVGQSVTGPTWGALVPRIVGDRLIGRAVGAQQALSSLAGLGGAAAGGVLYSAIGYHATLTLDTATFALLVVTGAVVQTRRGRRHDVANARPTDERVAASTGGSSGLPHIRADLLLRRLVPALWVFIVAVEATNVVEVFLVTEDLGAAASLYGAATASMMLGAILGPVLSARVTVEVRRVSCAGLAAAVLGALLVVIGMSPSIWLCLPLFALTGMSGGALNALIGTLVVTRSPEHIRGRVLATLNGTARGFSVLAMLFGGLLGQLLGARSTFVVCGALGVLTAVMVFRSRRGLVPATGAVAEPEPQLV